MKTTQSHLPALLTLLSLSACDVAPSESGDETLRSVLDGIGCPADEQIVELDGVEVCPIVTDWTGRAISSNYCRYNWTGQGDADVEALEAAPGVERVSSDCGAVTEQADLLATQFGPTLHERFAAQIDAIDAQEFASFTGIAPLSVTVAVVDASPTTIVNGTTSPHGEAMVDIVRDVACPAANCSISVQRVLALPLVEQGERDLVHGGYLGSFGDLAQGIRGAANLPGGRVIINLAVGWEPTQFGDRGQTAAVDAVYEALEYASCKGALIIAAAGNEAGFEEEGPLLPGGWESRPAPDTARCTELGVVGGRKPGYHPLVFSVASVDVNADAIQNARPGALPRMVTAGSHVNVETSSPTLTGTSTSTAALVGAAALSWSRFPNLDAPGVMGYLYGAGRPVGVDSDFQLGVAPFSVRQLDVCVALRDACAAKPGCSAALTCDGPSDLVDLQAELVTINDALNGTQHAPALQFSSCASTDLYSATTVLSCPVPEDPDNAYTAPQPTQPACPNCTIKKSGGIVAAALDPEYTNEVVTAVDVEVKAAGRSYYYRLGNIALSSATVKEITLVSPPPAYDSATISITFASTGRPMTNPLLILQ